MKSNVIRARELNGWTLEQAASRVGYRNRSGLFKLECKSCENSFTRKVSAEILIRLSKGYGVSIDFLLGLTNDPELSRTEVERFSVLRAVNEAVKAVSQDIAIKADKALSQSIQYKHHFDALRDVCEGVVSSSQRLIELNAQEFEDLRNGANFMRHQNNLKTMMDDINQRIKRESRLSTMQEKDIFDEAQYILNLSFENQNDQET